MGLCWKKFRVLNMAYHVRCLNILKQLGTRDVEIIVIDDTGALPPFRIWKNYPVGVTKPVIKQDLKDTLKTYWKNLDPNNVVDNTALNNANITEDVTV